MVGNAHKAHVQVVIVNYGTPDLTVDCLHALATEVTTMPGVRVSVVDNSSGDGSVQRIREAIAAHPWEGWVTLLPQKSNAGYAAANNAALRAELATADPPDYLWLLNPDTRPQPGALTALLDLMQREPLAGIAGSRLLDADGLGQASAFRFPSVWSELDEGLQLGIVSRLVRGRGLVAPLMDVAVPVDWVPGTSMMLRYEAIQAVGALDEGFFLYFEDVDLCRRAWRTGWQCWYVPESHVVHLHGQSPNVAGTQRWRGCIPGYWLASRRRYWRKHYSAAHAALADACWIGGLALWRVRRTLQRKPDTDPSGFLAQAVRHSTVLKDDLGEQAK
jgi:N-acetylglucosaminyl-diphospho-decaprenol L-rhamnosyltransferase